MAHLYIPQAALLVVFKALLQAAIGTVPVAELAGAVGIVMEVLAVFHNVFIPVLPVAVGTA